MLIVATYKLLVPEVINKFNIFNYSGLSEGYNKLNLIPPFRLDNVDTKEFDLKYSDYIFNNDIIFCNFFNIILSLFDGNDTMILINGSTLMDSLIESLLKMIQQRYGYNYQLVTVLEDINWYDESSFSISGLKAYDHDLNRYNNTTQIISSEFNKGCINKGYV